MQHQKLAWHARPKHPARKRWLNWICVASLVSFLFFPPPAYAQYDPDNAYQWNRQNVLNGNGRVDRSDWYEWWYYKVVVPETGEAFFFVYGVINPWDKKGRLAGTRSFVSAGDYQQHNFVENRFAVSDFRAAYDEVAVNINRNFASDKRIEGQVEDRDGKIISWDLSITRDWQFNAMGWGLHAPGFSGIYWYPAQASARMSGWINVKGRLYNLSNATAYQDRNWGNSFPKWWAWLVANNFKNHPGTSLVAGGGRPKIFDRAFMFNGLCIGLKHHGKEYVFRTTDGDSVQMHIRWGRWEVTAKDKNGYKIEIRAKAPASQFLLLPFQTPRGETFYDYEALQGHMTVKLSRFSVRDMKYVPILRLETEQAGIEWGSPKQVDLNKFFSQSLQLQ